MVLGYLHHRVRVEQRLFHLVLYCLPHATYWSELVRRYRRGGMTLTTLRQHRFMTTLLEDLVRV